MPQNEQIARIVQAAMGGAPAAAPAGPEASPAAAAPAPAAAPTASPAPTVEEQAIVAAAPTEDRADPFIEIDWDDKGKRKLTPASIKATFERYGALNARQAELKPVIALAEALMAKTGARPDQMAGFMIEAMRAATQKSGAPAQPAGGPGSPAVASTGPAPTANDPFDTWERENDVKLPPNYRAQVDGIQAMQQQIGQLTTLLKGVLTMGAGGAGKTAEAVQTANTERAMRVRQSIAHNLDAASTRLGLDESEANDFMAFAGERGYSLEDFADPDLTMTVVQDYTNTKGKPEFERLKGIHTRRQAWSDGVTPSPAGAAAPPAAGADQTLERLTNQALQGR